MVVGQRTIINLFMIMASHSNLLIPLGEGLKKPTQFDRLFGGGIVLCHNGGVIILEIWHWCHFSTTTKTIFSCETCP